MVKRMSTTIALELTESDDAKHRYSLYKIWDNKKPICTIITLYPGPAELVIADVTQLLISNHLYNQGFGSYYSVNLFSKLGISDRNKHQLINATDKKNDDVIIECIEKSAKVIFAWGSLPHTNKIAKDRVDGLLSKLKPYLDKCYYLSDEVGEDCFHPLAAKVRYEWNLIPLNLQTNH